MDENADGVQNYGIHGEKAMSGGGGDTQVQTSDPWSGQQPYLTQGFEGAQQGVLNNPGQGVVPFSPESEYAMQGISNRALQGNPLIGMGQQQMADTLGGNYMQGGQGFDAFADSAWNSVRPGMDSMFAGAGRYGSNAHSEALGKGFGRAMAPMYDSERNRQMQAGLAAPGMAGADYQDYGQLANVGAAREGKALQYSDEPYNRLSRYMGLIGGGYGGTQTTTGQGSNPLMGALGGAGAGAATGTMIMPGWGTAIGAGVGGLMGAFG